MIIVLRNTVLTVAYSVSEVYAMHITSGLVINFNPHDRYYAHL